MARIYLSSTYADLVTHREAVYRSLRQMHHDVIAMEDYVATDTRPLDKCRADVASCDIYVGVIAWRHGFIPENQEKSITELELEEAARTGKTCLIFLADDAAPWPPNLMDPDLSAVKTLRAGLRNDYMVSFFETAEDLAKDVVVAVTLALNPAAAEPGDSALLPSQMDYYRHFFGSKNSELGSEIRFWLHSRHALLATGALTLVAGLVMLNYIFSLGGAGVLACAFIPHDKMSSKRGEKVLIESFEYALRKNPPPPDVLTAAKRYLDRQYATLQASS